MHHVQGLSLTCIVSPSELFLCVSLSDPSCVSPGELFQPVSASVSMSRDLTSFFKLTRQPTVVSSRSQLHSARMHKKADEVWYIPTADESLPPSQFLISGVSVLAVGAHDHVRIWSRGGLAGELTLSAGDGKKFADAFGMLPSQTKPG